MIPAWLPDTVTTNLDRALTYTLLWGLEGIELRTLGTAEDRVPFVNESKLRRKLEVDGIPVVTVMPPLFEGALSDTAAWMNDLALLDETLAFCSRIGCSRIVVSPFEATDTDLDRAAEVLCRAGDRVDRQNGTLIVLNHPHSLAPTAHRLAEVLDLADHPAVRAGWNPETARAFGESPEEGLEVLREWVHLVRVLDDDDSGVTNWDALLLELARGGYDGPVSLEVVRRPAGKAGLQAATDLIHHIRNAQRRIRV